MPAYFDTRPAILFGSSHPELPKMPAYFDRGKVSTRWAGLYHPQRASRPAFVPPRTITPVRVLSIEGEPTGRIARWIDRLGEYHIKIVHRPGKSRTDPNPTGSQQVHVVRDWDQARARAETGQKAPRMDRPGALLPRLTSPGLPTKTEEALKTQPSMPKLAMARYFRNEWGVPSSTGEYRGGEWGVGPVRAVRRYWYKTTMRVASASMPFLTSMSRFSPNPQMLNPGMRALRGELNLLQYTMENTVWHLLTRRIPHYSQVPPAMGASRQGHQRVERTGRLDPVGGLLGHGSSRGRYLGR
ncbi:hypothetical protein B0T20DRAFT_485023 [Sordaria brevicollis]|uniref:Uncharacterized protein n=1 Tax=Sordaria brevicollis TaxID=83679 RepID=A0AAE0PM31_SORBR|nr:hypothetical protein B0T20DRAFT_485023 [Sordaria brevicollis]